MKRGKGGAVLFGILACASLPHFASASSVAGASECPCLPENSPKLSAARTIFSRLGYAAGRGPAASKPRVLVSCSDSQVGRKTLLHRLEIMLEGAHRVGMHQRFVSTITAVAFFFATGNPSAVST